MRNYGYIPDIDKEEDYVFGGGQVSGEIINPSGNWKPYLPVKELQNLNNIEVFACVSFTILNCIEILLKKQLLDGKFTEEQIQDSLDKGYLKKRI